MNTNAQYLLVTGATGLLGSYLVRDLLLSGRRLALVVRRDRRKSPRSRVERLIRQWEQMLGVQLPRPVVLEGDLSRPLCGLDEAARRWVRRSCDEMLNNAASLTFRGSDRAAEPWLTNVTGTGHALELARDAGLRHLHHVSTAYVCGLRSGRVLEAELDVGQAFGNDYEMSKVEAEKLVRAAGFLETATIHRPSIIVGDSRTGFTSTYHGLFAALRLGHTLLSRVVKGSTNGPALLALIGVDASAVKNFVPVDWVSAVIAHAVQTPASRGRTFHLTHPEPLSMDAVGRLVQQAVDRYSQGAAPDDPDLCDERWFAENLRTQLDVYTSYFRNDPEFDRANTLDIAGHIPCPTLDMPTLLRMARFAIEHDFGRQSPAVAAPSFDVERHLGTRLSLEPSFDQPTAAAARLGLEVDGAGGGQWTVLGSARQLLGVTPGIDGGADVLCRLD
ncbi:MAG: NAD-dependent epimerase/dehydratase family protein, partial [Planctomycetia bacterium]|nr:NAD-dependent epimerase/dehydratase family protein [Planctomycetia bacterium]